MDAVVEAEAPNGALLPHQGLVEVYQHGFTGAWFVRHFATKENVQLVSGRRLDDRRLQWTLWFDDAGFGQVLAEDLDGGSDDDMECFPLEDFFTMHLWRCDDGSEIVVQKLPGGTGVCAIDIHDRRFSQVLLKGHVGEQKKDVAVTVRWFDGRVWSCGCAVVWHVQQVIYAGFKWEKQPDPPSRFLWSRWSSWRDWTRHSQTGELFAGPASPTAANRSAAASERLLPWKGATTTAMLSILLVKSQQPSDREHEVWSKGGLRQHCRAVGLAILRLGLEGDWDLELVLDPEAQVHDAPRPPSGRNPVTLPVRGGCFSVPAEHQAAFMECVPKDTQWYIDPGCVSLARFARNLHQRVGVLRPFERQLLRAIGSHIENQVLELAIGKVDIVAEWRTAPTELDPAGTRASYQDPALERKLVAYTNAAHEICAGCDVVSVTVDKSRVGNVSLQNTILITPEGFGVCCPPQVFDILFLCSFARKNRIGQGGCA